jgi:ribosome biogenesis GTPase A
MSCMSCSLCYTLDRYCCRTVVHVKTSISACSPPSSLSGTPPHYRRNRSSAALIVGYPNAGKSSILNALRQRSGMKDGKRFSI